MTTNNNRVALFTGSGGGIGRAAALLWVLIAAPIHSSH